MDTNILVELDRVFKVQIETLSRVREDLDEVYERAVNLIFNCSGKVVVSGIGKSGIIARKIAATLTSTGTRSIFLHPSDGVHGDIGIVSDNDIFLAISKSGESEELLNVLPHIKSKGIGIISLTANKDSEMAKLSDCVLYTHIDYEACPLGLAPTSSTTAALVVGDALAMVLMKLKGFTLQDFSSFHPGGRIGKRLHTSVLDVMRGGIHNPVVDVNESFKTLIVEITRQRSGAVSIIDDESQLVGLITDYDIREVLVQNTDLFSLNIRDVMNQHPTYVFSDANITEALDVMEKRDRPFLVLPVLDRFTKKVVGMIHIHDLVAAGI